MSSVGSTNDKEARKAVHFILSKCQPGDWFVLNQLGKNVNTYFFRAFLKELRCQMKEKPKRSRSCASEATLKIPGKLPPGKSSYFKSPTVEPVEKSGGSPAETSSLISDENHRIDV